MVALIDPTAEEVTKLAKVFSDARRVAAQAQARHASATETHVLVGACEALGELMYTKDERHGYWRCRCGQLFPISDILVHWHNRCRHCNAPQFHPTTLAALRAAKRVSVAAFFVILRDVPADCTFEGRSA